MIFFGFYVNSTVKKYLQFQDSSEYIKRNAISIKQIADNDMQDEFDKLIYESNLIINNKNVKYSEFPEKDNVISGNYTLTLKGDYLSFIKYLNIINNKKILYKINDLSLKTSSSEGISIKLNLEALYAI